MITRKVNYKTILFNWKITPIIVPCLIEGLCAVERRADLSAKSCDRTTESSQACYFTDKPTETQDYYFQICKYPGRHHCIGCP